ncbi:MAG: trigger factor [Actinobacteria bacterium]|nr:trigger factor [Actinomycetota bacterium]
MQTLVEELPDNRVRLEVEVPSGDVQHAIDHAASDLAVSLKIPGFRKGKVPMQVLLARVGKERLYADAVESHIGGWFRNAAVRENVRPIAQPEYEYELPESRDESFRFTATVAVQPRPEVADWKELEVPRAEPEVPEQLIDQELEALRETAAALIPVEGRPAQEGDTIVVDLIQNGQSERDYVVELGSQRLLPEIEAGLMGMSVGETKQISYGDGDTVEATLREIKEKELPELDDELARAASEFDSLAELRTDIETRLREQLEDAVESEFRTAALGALVRESKVQLSPELVRQRASGLLRELLESLERRGLGFDNFLALTNQTAEQVEERIVAQAAGSIAGELVLEAIADDLGVEVSDEEIAEILREQGEDQETIEKVLASEVANQVRQDLRLRKALDQVVADVKPISVELAQARDKLWTPEQEKAPGDTKLWTPSSKEPAV